MIRTLTALALGLALSCAAVEPGSPAPAFTATNAAGTPVSLASYAGKIVVLEWVNFDCPFVKKHYAQGHMQKLQSTWTGKGVVWLSICSSAAGKQGHFTGADLTARIASEKAVPSHYLVDADGTVGKAYGATSTPTIVVIDEKGVVRYQGAIDSVRSTKTEDIAGAINYADAALTALTAGKPVEVAKTPSYGCGVKYAQ